MATPTSSAINQSPLPDANGHLPPGTPGAIWPYIPNAGANIAIAATFGALTLVHIVQAVWFRQRFCIVIIMGAIWETCAFVLRTLGAYHGRVVPFYVSSTILFILAPLWLNAFIFMLASRLIGRIMPNISVLSFKPKHLAKIFVCADIICFFVQAGGSGLMSSTGDSGDVAHNKKLGQSVYIVGCAFQLVCIIAFGFIMGRFFVKFRSISKYEAAFKLADIQLYIMFLVLALIVMRLIFRLVEFGPGVTTDNELISNEVYALALDAAPMIVAFALINLFHPGSCFKQQDLQSEGERYHLRSYASGGD